MRNDKEIAGYITQRLSADARANRPEGDKLTVCVREALNLEEQYAQSLASTAEYDEDAAYEVVLDAMCDAFPDIRTSSLAEIVNACVLITSDYVRLAEPGALYKL